MVESSHDLEGNIQLDTFDQEEQKQPSTGTGGFRSENDRPQSAASSQNSNVAGETFNTLDEPVSETIVSTTTACHLC